MIATEQRLRKLERRVDELEETLDIMSDKRLVRGIERSLKDLEEGRCVNTRGQIFVLGSRRKFTLTYLVVPTSNFTRGLKKVSSTDRQCAQKILAELDNLV